MTAAVGASATAGSADATPGSASSRSTPTAPPASSPSSVLLTFEPLRLMFVAPPLDPSRDVLPPGMARTVSPVVDLRKGRVLMEL
jgi:hypothetical protein